MKSYVIIFLCSITFLFESFAQADQCDRWSLGVNFTITQPIEEMYDNGFRTSYGMTWNALYNFTPGDPFMEIHGGLKITGGMGIGERNQIILASPDGARATSSIYNTLVDLSLMSRLVYNANQPIQFYSDFYIGGRFTGTNQDIRLEQNVSGYDRRNSERLTQSANWSCGTTNGILIQLRPNTFLDVGVSCTYSAENTYVDLDSYTYNRINDNIEYDIVRSVSNSVGLHIGFHTYLDCSSTFRKDRERRRGNRRIKTRKRKPQTRRAPSGQS